MAFGVMGGPMQAQGHLQLMLRMELYGQNPQAATDAPRWRVISGREVQLEPGFPAKVVETLRRMGHEVAFEAPDVFGFGGAQIVRRIDDGYIAGSDPRKDGCAAGY